MFEFFVLVVLGEEVVRIFGNRFYLFYFSLYNLVLMVFIKYNFFLEL